MLKIYERNRKIQDQVRFKNKLGRFRDVRLLSLLYKRSHSSWKQNAVMNGIIKMSFSNA
jgi:hypothetical protein